MLQMAPLWSATALMLALPRVMGALAIVVRGEQRAYGGTGSLVRGALLEGALSVLQAPVRMMAHTLFVVVALTGLKLDWKSPPRQATDIRWSEAARRFALLGAAVAAVGNSVFLVQPQLILWLMPIGLPLLLAVPLTVLTSRSILGQRLLAHRLLLTPEEHFAPTPLRQAWAHARHPDPPRQWRDTLTDPWLFDVVRSAMGQRNTGWGSRGKARRLLVRGLLLDQDTERLSSSDRMHLLSEPQNMVRLRDQLAANAGLARRRWTDPPLAFQASMASRHSRNGANGGIGAVSAGSTPPGVVSSGSQVNDRCIASPTLRGQAALASLFSQWNSSTRAPQAATWTQAAIGSAASTHKDDGS